VPPLLDPRAVEINIFADLTISKEEKTIPEDIVLKKKYMRHVSV
jgi:hypothetical protein